MIEALKEEAIVNKVGGRFKLSTLIQKRLVAVTAGACMGRSSWCRRSRPSPPSARRSRAPSRSASTRPPSAAAHRAVLDKGRSVSPTMPAKRLRRNLTVGDVGGRADDRA